MAEPFGRTLSLSLPRRFICDLMHLARQVRSVPVQRSMNLAAVATARRLVVPKPSWWAVFSKAYGFVAAARPEFRRAYIPFPWPHLYEHANNIASIAMERRVGMKRLSSLELQPPKEIDHRDIADAS